MTHKTASRKFLIPLLTICQILLVAPSLAQITTGAITGNLLDPNGSVITGLSSSITLTSVESGVVYDTNVTLQGQYSFAKIPPGVYNLNFPVSCCMYRTYAEENVEILAGSSLSRDLELEWHINLGTIGDDPGMLAEDMISQSGDLSGPTPRMPDGKPDFSGVWYNVPDREPARPDPLQPWAAEIQQQLRELGQQGPASYCLPQSAVISTLIFPYKFVQTDDLLVQMIEFVTPGFRQIFLDGRTQPEIWNPSWYGFSTGHWEGDTLVVESTGFNEITPGFGVHTEALKVTERYTRPQNDILLIEVIAEDPEAFTEIWTRNYEARLVEGQEILEFVCAEGNDTSLFAQPVWRGRP